jgi:hypothetical protein
MFHEFVATPTDSLSCRENRLINASQPSDSLRESDEAVLNSRFQTGFERSYIYRGPSAQSG